MDSCLHKVERYNGVEMGIAIGKIFGVFECMSCHRVRLKEVSNKELLRMKPGEMIYKLG